VLDVVARVKQHLTLSIKLKRLAWLIYFFCPLEVFSATLGELSLSGVNDLVQVVDLSEATLLLFEQIY